SRSSQAHTIARHRIAQDVAYEAVIRNRRLSGDDEVARFRIQPWQWIALDEARLAFGVEAEIYASQVAATQEIIRPKCLVFDSHQGWLRQPRWYAVAHNCAIIALCFERVDEGYVILRSGESDLHRG